jgi:purine-binding chemotaxis protein CheW
LVNLAEAIMKKRQLEESMSETTVNYLSFRVGPEWYGVELGYITEVLHLVGLTEVPGTGADVLGLLTLRNTVMPVVDLRVRFRLPDAALQLNSPMIAMQTPKGAIALVVDDVDDVEEVSNVLDYEGEATIYVKGVVRQEDRLLLLLDIEKIYAESRLQEVQTVVSAQPAANPIIADVEEAEA